MYPPVGTKVRSKQTQDRFPNGILEIGEIGTVCLIQPNEQLRVSVKMERHFDWLSEWNNEFHWYEEDEHCCGKFEDYWEILPAA